MYGQNISCGILKGTLRMRGKRRKSRETYTRSMNTLLYWSYLILDS